MFASISKAVACPFKVRVQVTPPFVDFNIPKGGGEGAPSLLSRPNPPRDVAARMTSGLVGWTRRRLTVPRAKLDTASVVQVLAPSVDLKIPKPVCPTPAPEPPSDSPVPT